MFYKIQQKQNILSIDQNFASLKDVQFIDKYQSYTCSITYQIPIESVFNDNLFKVRISILSKIIPYESIKDRVLSLRGSSQNAQLIAELQNNLLYIRNNTIKQEQYVLTSLNSDVSAYVNNQDISALQNKNFNNTTNLVTKKLRTRQIKQLNEVNTPILTYTKLTQENVTQITSQRKEYLNMIIRDGLDPSYIVDLPHNSITARQTTQGLLQKKRTRSNNVSNLDAATKVANSILINTKTPQQNTQNTTNENNFIQTFESITQKMYLITEDIVFNNTLLNNNKHVIVQFEVFNTKNNKIISTTTKELNLDNLLTNYFTPKKAPIVNVIYDRQTTLTNLEITIQDKINICKKVRLYKKILPTTSAQPTDYQLIGDFDVNNQTIKIPIQYTQQNYCIYRIIPIGYFDNIGHEYTNVVVTPQQIYELSTTVLNTQIIEQGISIEARFLPDNISAVQFLVKNLTRHDSIWSNIGSPILLTTSDKQLNYVSIIDSSVKHKQIYEYAIKLIYATGTTVIVGNTNVKFIKQETGIVATTISNVQTITTNNELNVIFNFNTELINTNIDIVRSLLSSAGIEQYFANDIIQEKSFFKKILAHLIIRKNLTTGEQETFNVILGDTFSDVALRQQNTIKDLQLNCAYRYEIYPLLRTPDTMLENLIKTVTDKSTNKQYTFSPIKYLHPITLSEGIILSSQGRKLLYSSDEFVHGIIGNVQTVEITFDNIPISINDFTVTRVEKKFNKLTWSVVGNLNLIDHFLIIKDVLGVRTFVGKCHTQLENVDISFLHQLSEDDNGIFQYILIPVLSSYNLGLQTISDIIEVEV